MFERLEPAPPDAILGISEAFKSDPNPAKINLSVGVYKDANAETPVLACVKEAERRILESESTKSYLGIDGLPEYGRLVRELLFGTNHEVITSSRSVSVQAPGGTAAIRVAAEFIKKLFPSARMWCSQPTWPNHPKVFDAAGLQVGTYPYFDAENHNLDFESMLAALRDIPSGDAICLHACCHNPSGVDPTREQWQAIADVVYEGGLLPLLDFAYQGFGDGLREDAVAIKEFCRPGCELLVASSFSKNFSLYRERVGALTVVAADADAAQTVLSQLKACVRANYSNPPAHGAAIVEHILGDVELRAQWEDELSQMRDRINGMRHLFSETMKAKAPQHDLSFITQGRGMFAFSGLTGEQVDQLRDKHSIYMVRSGRINVAGMSEDNMDRLCSAIASVL